MSELADRLEREQQERRNVNWSGPANAPLAQAEAALTEAISVLREQQIALMEDSASAELEKAGLRRVIEQMRNVMKEAYESMGNDWGEIPDREVEEVLAAAEEILK